LASHSSTWPLNASCAQPDARVLVLQPRAQAPDHRPHRRHDADVHRPRRADEFAPHLGHDGVAVGEDRLGTGQQQTAELGRHHAASGAVEQAAADLRLQRGELPAEDGGRRAQHRGAAREAAVLGDAGEAAQSGEQVHRLSFRESWFPRIEDAGRRL
jgi:hypothetical protein